METFICTTYYSHSVIGIKLFVPPVYLWIILHFTIGFCASKPNIMQIIMVKRYTKRAYKISGNYTDTPRTITTPVRFTILRTVLVGLCSP